MATSKVGGGRLTREQIEAMFVRRQEALDNLDAAALSANYAEDCGVESHANGEIVREQRIYDFTGMLVQIGVLKVKQAKDPQHAN